MARSLYGLGSGIESEREYQKRKLIEFGLIQDSASPKSNEEGRLLDSFDYLGRLIAGTFIAGAITISSILLLGKGCESDRQYQPNNGLEEKITVNKVTDSLR